MKRTWLSKKYPGGIGLGDVLYEYLKNREKRSDVMEYTDLKESTKRETELRFLLNSMYKLSYTPIFDWEKGAIYFEDE